MRGQHSKDLPATRHQGSGLHRAHSRAPHDAESRLACKNRAGRNILDDDPLAALQCCAEGGLALVDMIHEIHESCIEAAMCGNVQNTVFKQLDIAHVRARDFDRCVDNLRQQIRQSVRLRRPGAELLDAGHGREVRRELRIQRLNGPVGAFAVRNIARDL